jgi:hypothetical protein
MGITLRKICQKELPKERAAPLSPMSERNSGAIKATERLLMME